jgi:hypothetical protein
MCANLDAFDEGIAHDINFNQIATGFGEFGSLFFLHIPLELNFWTRTLQYNYTGRGHSDQQS